MQSSPVNLKAKVAATFPIRILLVGIAVSVLLFAGVGKHMWESYQDLRAAQDRDIRLQQLTGAITYLDEVLTMSARMNAATGDTSWEARYRRFEPQLDDAIQEAKALAPSSYVSAAAVQTDEANVALVEMEHRSLDLVRAGDTQGASAVLASPMYEQQKQLYAEGYQEIGESMQASGRHDIASAQDQWLISIAFVAVPLLLIVWFVILVSMNRHIKARRTAEDALREQARRDPLTGVLNHGAIVDELLAFATVSSIGRECAVAMVDVDGLKNTNDVFGHLVGDAALVAISGALQNESVIVGRYGGDEFIVILPDAGRKDAQRYCTEVNARLANASQTDAVTGQRVPLAATIGVAVYPQEAQTAAELIKLADDAMYDARLQRPVITNVKGMPSRRDERAAHMVSEVIPLLTSDASLTDKVRLVAHQLSVGAGYEIVNFELLGSGGPVAATYAFGQLNPRALEQWKKRNTQPAGKSLHPILERTHRPVIVNDMMTDPRISEVDRSMAAAVGVHSALAAPMLWHDEFVGILSVASKRASAFGPRDAQFVSSVATQVTAIVRMAKLLDDLRATTGRLCDAQDETVMLLAEVAEAHLAGLSHHFQGVRSLAAALACELGYSDSEAREVGLAAALHDVGKIRVPHDALWSDGPLSTQQWEVMKQHTIWGEAFFTDRAGFHLAAVVARSHHEHWDGGGYPDGLVGDQIADVAAITSVADAYDAIVNVRSYHAARSTDEAVQEIVSVSGKQFSPRVVDALVRLHARSALPSARGSLQRIAA